jgi:hypothetical protein
MISVAPFFPWGRACGFLDESRASEKPNLWLGLNGKELRYEGGSKRHTNRTCGVAVLGIQPCLSCR